MIKICKVNDLKNNTPKEILLDKKKLLVVKFNLKIYVLDNYCLHKGAKLSKGKLIDRYIVCPLHGCKWDITTGENNHNSMILKKYVAKVEDGIVIIDDI